MNTRYGTSSGHLRCTVTRDASTPTPNFVRNSGGCFQVSTVQPLRIHTLTYCRYTSHITCGKRGPLWLMLMPDAPAQGRDDDSPRLFPLPPLNLLASLRVRQDEDNGDVVCCCCLHRVLLLPPSACASDTAAPMVLYDTHSCFSTVPEAS